MPKTVEEYMQRTQALIDHGGVSDTIEPTSALLDETLDSSMNGRIFIILPDFGYLLCWCRLDLLEREFDPEYAPLWKFTQQELDQRRAAAESSFDDLLNQFLQQGYRPEMGERLLEIGDNFHNYTLGAVYVLPNDLDELLTNVGNPLADDEDEEEGERELTAAAIGFELNNPEHRKALADWLSRVN